MNEGFMHSQFCYPFSIPTANFFRPRPKKYNKPILMKGLQGMMRKPPVKITVWGGFPCLTRETLVLPEMGGSGIVADGNSVVLIVVLQSFQLFPAFI
jgi:hypothetical protein